MGDPGERMGATYLGDGRCRFRVWAPFAERVEVVPGEEGGGPTEPGAAVPPAWRGVPLRNLVFYELHVGTFTADGTFEAAVRHLPRLADLGVTALELMPVAEFSGARNWGYDGVFPFAAQSTYGGPAGLRRLVAACHAHGLACFLDVVYNHLGPEGAVQGRFGPYLTDRYRTPWGPALNLDGPGSDEVRRYFVDNALYWIEEIGMDGLRLDAVHAVSDLSERPFLAELGEAVEEAARRLGREVHLVAESADNTLRFLRPRADSGCGHDAQWSDDLHHALHAALTGERGGYYRDYDGLSDLARACGRGWVYTGQPSVYRGRRHGERLAALVPFEAVKLAAAAVLLSPFLPLLFMGEEHGETAPFLYFTSHSSPDLARAVREGRRRDFAAFGWGEEVPDSQDPETFERSRVRWERGDTDHGRALQAWYRELLRLRREHREHPDLGAAASWEGIAAEADAETGVLALRRGTVLALLCVSGRPGEARLPEGDGPWALVLDSAAPRWGGPGSGPPERAEGGAAVALPAHAVAVYERPADPARPDAS